MASAGPALPLPSGPRHSELTKGSTKMDSVHAAHFTVEAFEKELSSATTQTGLTCPMILVATIDSDIRSSLSALLEARQRKVVWAKSVEEVRSALARKNISACFCGFWLVDGTYRDVIRLLKTRPVEIPAIIACSPACPHEYQDYLAALNLRAFDFIRFPYSAGALERALRSVIGPQDSSDPKSVSTRDPGNIRENQGGLRKAG
jgi:DNA-binding NtrC family response regulator